MEAKKLAISKKLILIWCGSLIFIVSILLAADFTYNFTSPELAQYKALPDLPVAVSVDGQSHKSNATEQLEQILARYIDPDVKYIDDSDPMWPSVEQQKMQKGIVRNLYIGNKLYQLKGVVYRANWVALLKSIEAESNSSKLLNIALNDEIGPYVVTFIDSRSLKLTDNDREVELKLFYPEDKIDQQSKTANNEKRIGKVNSEE